MSEYYGFMKEIKGVKGAVMGNFLHFFKCKKNQRIRKGQAAICCSPHSGTGSKLKRTECGVVMLANEHSWQ